jgi:uncharacterized phage protein gp47/JayE
MIDPGRPFAKPYADLIASLEHSLRDAGLTDFNAGSVAGTLARAVAHELTLLYAQIDEAYRRAFIDVATDVALDNVVALLGVARNPALAASGHITFFRNSPADWTYIIPVGTRVADAGGRIFVTTAEGAIPQETDEFSKQSGGVLKTDRRIAGLVGVWPREASPDPKTSLETTDTGPQKPFGNDERTITLAEEVRPEGELHVRYKPKSARVPIEAVEPGPQGNAGAGIVVIMPTPPTGISGVVNEESIAGGQDAEPDDQLRERARHALERAGNATLSAIKFAVLDVDGVTGAEVLDHSLDESIPLGEIWVHYTTASGDQQRLEQIANQVTLVVDETRAAGVVARPKPIGAVTISGVFYVLPTPDAAPDAPGAFRQAVIAAIAALAAGAPLSMRRLNALVYQVAGLAEVAEAQLSFQRDAPPPGQPATGDVPDPMTIARTEQFRPDPGSLKVIMLRQLAVQEIRRTGATGEIDLQLRSADGPVRFKNLSLDVSVTIKATLKQATGQPPERVTSFVHHVVFTNSDTATSPIALGDLTNVSDVTVTLAAAAYAGLGSGTKTITVSG